MSTDDLFGAPLQADPAVALPPFKIDPKLLKSGPLHRLHFMVEIVGPRTLPATQAKALLDPKWQAPLGQPVVYAMSPADEAWRPLTAADPAQTYDSLALVWPYFSARGSLSTPAAQQLLKTAEQYATQVQRRAMSVPTPEEVAVVTAKLTEAKNNLDVGFSLTAESRVGLAERAIWLACAQLGLEFDGSGLFQYRAADWEEPIVEVYPLGAPAFSLGAVQQNALHEGVGIGFNVPRSPDPLLALEAALRIASHFKNSLGCVLYDESEEPLHEGQEAGLRESVKQAVWALGQYGIVPGSVEARALFGA